MKQYWRELILNYKVFFALRQEIQALMYWGYFLANAFACYTDHVIFPFKNKTMKSIYKQVLLAVGYLAVIFLLNALLQK